MRYHVPAYAAQGGSSVSCTKCQKLRDDWLDAMIARDVARLAKTTAEAVKHIIKPKDD